MVEVLIYASGLFTGLIISKYLRPQVITPPYVSEGEVLLDGINEASSMMTDQKHRTKPKVNDDAAIAKREARLNYE